MDYKPMHPRMNPKDHDGRAVLDNYEAGKVENIFKPKYNDISKGYDDAHPEAPVEEKKEEEEFELPIEVKKEELPKKKSEEFMPIQHSQEIVVPKSSKKLIEDAIKAVKKVE